MYDASAFLYRVYNYLTNVSLTILLGQARFACLRCAAGGHFVSAGGSLRSPGVTLVNYKGDNISKYVCPTDLINMARKISIFKILMSNDDVIKK